ncbi:succinyldiaminopimelate transaminase [Ectothiorhodospiraceae bacterium WFHF3C12]|nr:succinyldiaminopimelate transaminase [Ectothiorhodospiraceae bacterium WFHF3C12]
MNSDLDRLQPYPFERLRALKAGLAPVTRQTHISLAIGEPQHGAPHLVTEALIEHAHGVNHYVPTAGGEELREAICEWLTERFALPADALDPARHVLPLAGTREGLFAIAQALVDRRTDSPVVVMPNPFYQIYEGAALLAGAQPYFLNCWAANGYQPDFDAVPEDVWARCQLVYICSPGNPSGAVIPTAALRRLIELADRHDFVIACDECYSEIYLDEDAPPPGLLQACAEMGRDDFQRCLVFHSLSKRSSAPGLRSGFVAGDAGILERFLLYRTYQGCAMPLQTQAASLAAWRDENHVRNNRKAYRSKLQAALNILGPVMEVTPPEAGFYLWARTPLPDEAFTRQLFQQHNVTVLPGSYLSRETAEGNPGADHVRIALVAESEACAEALWRIRHFAESLQQA